MRYASGLPSSGGRESRSLTVTSAARRPAASHALASSAWSLRSAWARSARWPRVRCRALRATAVTGSSWSKGAAWSILCWAKPTRASRPPTPAFVHAPDALPSGFGLTTPKPNGTLRRCAFRPCKASTIQRTRDRPHASHRCVALVRGGDFASRPFHATASARDLIHIAAQAGVMLLNAQ